MEDLPKDLKIAGLLIGTIQKRRSFHEPVSILVATCPCPV